MEVGMHRPGTQSGIAAAIFVLLIGSAFQIGCSTSSEKSNADAQATKALKAKLVYYAIPG